MAEKKYSDSKWIARKITVFNRYNGKCFYCNGRLRIEDMHMDHYVPRSKGGSYNIKNIVASCPRCNLIKNNLSHDDFLRKISLRVMELSLTLKYYRKILRNV